jgi:predicted O-linked N-acetylglucosamine transferase (SPINDLY family)
LALDPANHDAAMALSVVLMRLHRHTEAADLLTTLLDQERGRAGALCNLATTLTALGRQQHAVECAREAIALAPAHPAPYRALCNALPYHPAATGAVLLAAARACAVRQPRAMLGPMCNNRDPARRLKLGLLSGVLRCHPVGWLTVAGFEHLDPASFEITCLTPNKPEDAIGRRFAAIAAGWEDTGSLDDRQLAERARSLDLDIVIDLGGYGDFGRMPALAHRAAPVQIKWVGMQNHSTGLDEMDWLITDRWETPDGFAQLYSERLLILPDGYICYTPPPDAPEPGVLPALARGSITFGCYNNLAKITPDVVAAWSRILRALPTARMIVKTHQFNDRNTCRALLDAFDGEGVKSDRIELRGSSPHRELLRQYGDIDIVLDPFPYSGGLTTCEALWMGVPTLTMPGDTFAGRHSASHMSNVGLGDWIAADLDDYVAQAVGRATDHTALALLRAGLRARMARSPLCDAPRFGASLGRALRMAWQSWCAGDPARTPVHV